MLQSMVSWPVSLGIKHPSGPYDQIFITAKTVGGLLMWGALSDKRRSLSFTIAPGTRQRSHPWVWVPWDSWPYFTVSDLWLPFSSPPTTRRATVKIFDLTSTWCCLFLLQTVLLITPMQGPGRAHRFQQYLYCCMRYPLLQGNSSTCYNIDWAG
jgi:hypothetical protein